MQRRLMGMVLVTLVANAATASVVIREWGGHNTNDYLIENVGGNDVGVLILANTQPTVVWKFEAYDNGLLNEPPADIDYINIDSIVPVGGIVLSVIGDSSMGHVRGARDLKSLDLVTNGIGNDIDTIDITGDFGALGPMLATNASTLTIDGYTWNNIDVTENIGPLTVGGRMGASVTCLKLGDVNIKELLGFVTSGSMGNVNIGDAQHLTHTGGLTITGSNGYDKTLYVDGLFDGTIHIGQSLTPNGAIVVTGSLSVLEIGHHLEGNVLVGGSNSGCTVGMQISDAEVRGTLTVLGDLDVLNVRALNGGTITVGGNLLYGRILIQFYAGTMDLYTAETLIVAPNSEGGLLGTLTADSIGLLHAGPVSGTVNVTGQLTAAHLNSLRAGSEISADSFGTLHVYSESSGLSMEGEIVAGNIATLIVDGGMLGTIDATEVGSMTLEGQVVGGVHVTGAVTSADLNWGVAVTGSVEAGSIDTLTVSGPPTYGTVHVDGALGTATFVSNIAQNGVLEAGTIETLTVGEDSPQSAPFRGTIVTTGELGMASFLRGMETPGSLTADTVGDLVVIGNVGGSISVVNALTGRLGGNLTHPCILTSNGTIEAGSLPGVLELDADASGAIRVFGEVGGSISVRASSPPPDSIEANLLGSIYRATQLSGSIIVDGSIANSGAITVVGVLDDPNGDLSGGHILIGRSLLAGATISVASGLNFVPDTEFVTTRYGGWGGEEEGWAIDPDATIIIGNATCDPNYPPGDCPDINVWGVTSCRGDMDNSGATDFDDLNPFIEALTTDPNVYSIAHPGLGGTADNYLGGALLFHGDCNCDGRVDFDDIDPFIALLSMDCTAACLGQDQQLMAASDLAAGMRTHIPQSRHAALRAFIATVVAHHQHDAQKRAYWHAVAENLEE